jgi:hypothetical protein
MQLGVLGETRGGQADGGASMASGEPGAVLRVECMLGAGLRLRMVAEPVRPG